jgi:hypothetical protein
MSITMVEHKKSMAPLKCDCEECKCLTASQCYSSCLCGCCRYYFGEKDDGEMEKMVDVPFSEAEVLMLHAVAVLGDGRTATIRLLRKRISPVAIPILKAAVEERAKSR